VEPVKSGVIYVDGVDLGEEADAALRDRRMLAGDGIFVVVATISEQTGESVADPEVIFRGVPYTIDEDQLIDELRDGVDASLVQAAKDGVHDLDALQAILHDDLAALVFKKLKRRPMVMPVVVEV
jgi:ribonuclease J